MKSEKWELRIDLYRDKYREKWKEKVTRDEMRKILGYIIKSNAVDVTRSLHMKCQTEASEQLFICSRVTLYPNG